MFTVKQCRKLFGKNCQATDAEIERARDHLAFIAELGIDLYLEAMRASGQLTDRQEYEQFEDWDDSDSRPEIPVI